MDSWNCFVDDRSSFLIIGRFGVSCFRRGVITARTATTTSDAGGCGGIAGFGLGDGGEMLSFSFLNFWRVVDRSGSCKRCDGQSVGQDAESHGICYIADADFFAVGIDVRPAADLVTPSIAKV